MSKRSNRRVAVVATAALALGAIAPSALALRIGTGAGAVVDIDPATLVSDDLDLLGLPEVDDVLLGTGLFGAFTVDRIFDSVDTLSTNLDEVVGAADLGDVLPECVAVVGCSLGSPLTIPVNVGGINVLNSGILNGGDLGVGVVAPIVVPVVANVLNGGLLNNGLPLGLGGLLDPSVGLLAVVGLGL